MARNKLWLSCFLVFAACGEGTTPPDKEPVADTTAPVAGSALTFSGIVADGVTVTWGSASDAVTRSADLKYKLVRAGAAKDIDTLAEADAITDGPELVQDYTRGSISSAVAGLTSATSYAFAVIVKDEADNRALYAPATMSTLDATAPTVGKAIGFSNVAATSLTVTWGAATDAETASAKLLYKVVKATSSAKIDTLAEVQAISPGADLVQDFAASITSMKVKELSSSTTYAFAVVAKDQAGNEALYSPATVTTLDVTAPKAGAAISFSKLGADSVTVSWGAAKDAATKPEALRYKLVKASDRAQIDTLDEVNAIVDGDSLVKDFTANLTTQAVHGLSSSSSYAFAVVVEDEAGNATLYAPAVVSTLDVSAPAVGALLSFSDVTATGLTLSWGAASDDISAQSALQYKVVKALSVAAIDSLAEVAAITSGPDLVQDFMSATTSKGVTGLSSGVSYAFSVVVVDEAGNQALYSPATQSTIDIVSPVPGVAVNFADITATSLTVNWGAATDNVSLQNSLEYKLVRASSASDIDTIDEVDSIVGADLLQDYAANITTLAVSDLTSFTSYAFAVVVRDGAGNQALFAPAVVTTLDVSAPTVGADIYFTSVGPTSVTVNWGVATDDATAQAGLEYKVVAAAQAADIDSLDEVDAITSGPGLLMDFAEDTTVFAASGLTSSTSYAFAVVVRDAAGNHALYTPAVQSTLDVTSPIVGTPISFTNVYATTVDVNWGVGTDDVTLQPDLQYKVVRAAASTDIDTVAEADSITSGSGLVQDYTSNVAMASATGMSELTTYWFAVLVRDASGNVELYAPASVSLPDGTAPTPGSPIRFSAVSSSGLTATWGVATDGASPQSSLEYKVVRATASASIDTPAEADAIAGADLLVDWTANQSTHAVTGLSEGDFHFYAVVVRDPAHNLALYAPIGRVTGRVVYVSTSPHSSNLGGPSGADTLCGTLRDSRVATDVSPKAILAAGNTRRACTSANCTSASENVDWPLLASTTYYNVNGGLIGTTNTAGIFAFPVANALSPGSTAYTYAGFNNNWTSNGANCSEFSEDSSTGTLYLGRPAQTSVSAIWYANTLCSYSVSVVPISLLCVEP